MKITNDRRANGARAILLGLSLAALASTASAANLVISNWDGYMAPDAMAAFKTATGVSGEVVVHATNEEIMGKLIAAGGKGYDVVFVSSPFAEVLNKLGLTEPVDHAKIPNLANLYPEATKLPHDVGFDMIEIDPQSRAVKPFLKPLARPTDLHLSAKGKIYICEYTRQLANAGEEHPGRILELAKRIK